jgi:signal transduction histidine kinase
MALQYFLKAKQLNDSLQQVEKNIKAIDLRAHVDELEKEHTIEELQKNNNQKVIFLTIAISVSILSVIVIFLVVFYLKRLRTFIKKHRQLNLQVTQQKIELEKAVHKLEIAYKEKDKILNIVAHDLRSPINSILALADILSQSATMNKELSEAIELIKTACQNSLGLSKEILESAILMQSKELNLAEISINELMANTVSLLRFRSAEKQINLELLLTKKDYCLRVDKDKIQRVFNNLITNAIKFSQHGSTISVAMEADDEGLIIKVKDFGIGIPEKIRPIIFDMFTEAKREGTDGEKAYGLGLSITKQIVEIHGGKIWVESEEGVGTIFFVFLPFNFIVPEL